MCQSKRTSDHGHLAADPTWPSVIQPLSRHCQTKTIGSPKTSKRPLLGSKLTLLDECRGAIGLEVFAAKKVALLVEVIVN